jgi:uncharacterized OsmC-like protein
MLSRPRSEIARLVRLSIGCPIVVRITRPGLNGVDPAAVREVAERYLADPDSGRRGFSTRVRWLGGYRTESALAEGALILGDGPLELAGSGTGPSPEDMLLAAVGQCLIVGLAGTASARGIALEELEALVSGTVNLTAAYGLEPGASPGFQQIEIDVHLRADAPREQLQALLDDAMALAPIPNTVALPVPVTARLA